MAFMSVFSKHRYAKVAPRDPVLGLEEPKVLSEPMKARGYHFSWWSCVFALSLIINIILSSFGNPWAATDAKSSPSKFGKFSNIPCKHKDISDIYCS